MSSKTKAISKRKSSASDQTVPAAKRMRSSFKETLTVIVGQGDNTETFLVHKDLIANRSKFFKAATSTQTYIEAVEKIVRLPEHEARTFQMYLECLYNPETDLASLVRETAESDGMEEAPPGLVSLRLAKSWVLGDYIGDPKFQNKVVKVVQRLSADGILLIDEETTEYIASNTSCNSGFYRLVVEEHFQALEFVGYKPKMTDRWIAQIPEDLAKELLKRTLRDRPGSERWIKPDYNDFLEDEEA